MALLYNYNEEEKADAFTPSGKTRWNTWMSDLCDLCQSAGAAGAAGAAVQLKQWLPLSLCK